MSLTLQSLASYCEVHGWLDRTSLGLDELETWINDTVQYLARARRWPFYQKVGYISLTEPYEEGTVTLTANSTAATGAAVDWSDDMEGQEFYTSDDSGRLYEIASVVPSPDSLTLASAYLGTGGAGLSYAIRYVRYDAPSDWDRPGPFYTEDGRELSFGKMTFDEWHRQRMLSRNIAAMPEQVVVQEVGGTPYFFVHPAPSAAGQVRFVYWHAPVTITDSVDSDWPESLRGLLQTALRLRMTKDTPNAGMEALESREFQADIDLAFSAYRPLGPIPVRFPARDGGRVSVEGIKALFNITD